MASHQKLFKMTRHSVDNIAKDLYKRLNAPKESYYYEKEEDCAGTYYLPIGYSDVAVAEYLGNTPHLITEGKIYMASQIEVDELGVEKKLLIAVDESGHRVGISADLPNGRITKRASCEYIEKLWTHLSRERVAPAPAPRPIPLVRSNAPAPIAPAPPNA